MKSNQGNRWFIWTLVIVVVVGVGLVAYMDYVGMTDSAQMVPSFLVHHAKPMHVKK